MSKTTPAITLNDLEALSTEKEKILLSKFPQVRPLLFPNDPAQTNTTAASMDDADNQNAEVVHDATHLLELTHIAQQELDATFDRLATTLSDPQLLGQIEMRLYIEQQLSDLLQLSVSSQIGETPLPVQMGSLYGTKHKKRDSQDTLEQHGTVLEAELDLVRLDAPSQSFSSGVEVAERFGLFYPIWLLPNFKHQPEAILKEWIGQQLLVINPIAKRVVVATILGLHPPSYRYSFSGTPELVRASGAWNPGSAGQVILFCLESQAANGLYYV